MSEQNPASPNPAYTVLARRCRPQSFEEVVGQQHVGQAIRNAIRSGRVAHAYLFTGARGVGKTSTARIFAKALNCPNVQDGVPCNQCEICQGIGAGNDVDVLEIDGASNRGIDDIRQLRANVSVRSMRSPCKVYIIDEVHMLTKEAFNALLKTLEEPPPNVKFVFCTTEPNKVPDTILSRCQRFDFGTISQSDIADRLRQIAVSEGREVDDDAVELVARRANGSMRDSQSLFDQLLAFGGERITARDVHQLLGTATDDRLIDLVEALIGNQPATALQAIESALDQGVQIGSLSDQLLAYLRDLMVTAAGAKEISLSAVTDSSREQVRQQAERWGLRTISAAMQILAETKSRMQRASFARALMELAVVRMAALEDLEQISTLILRAGTGASITLPTGSSSTGSLAAEATPGKSTGPAPTSAPGLKKNNDPPPAPVSPRIVSEPAIVPESPPAKAERSDSSAQGVVNSSFTEENLNELWERLLREVPEKMAESLQKASKRAISGPNLLEIWFPKGYTFEKHYFENPETSKKLATVIQEIVGKTVDCRFSIDRNAETGREAARRPEKPRLPERRKASAVDGDAFVQMAVSLFGGQVVEVRPLPNEIISSQSEEMMEDQVDES